MTKKENITAKKCIERIIDITDDMNDNQIKRLESYAEYILNEGANKEDPADDKMTVTGIMAIMELSKAERMTISSCLNLDDEALKNLLTSKSVEDLEKAKARKQATVDQLTQFPAAVMAAHALANLETLTFELEEIKDAAKENADCRGNENYAGQYKLFLQAVETSVNRMLEYFRSDSQSEEQDVLYMLATETEDPTIKN